MIQQLSQSMVSKSKLAIIFLLFGIIVGLFSLTAPKNNFYTRPYDADYFAEIYSNSQYIKGETAQRSIGDDGLYPFAGFYYIQGGDPSQVNFENPTVGKYLIGVSILLFGNENSIYLIYATAVLFITYLMAQKLFKNSLHAFFAPAMLLASSFFQIQFVPNSSEQLSIALLDLPLTLFLLIGIYFFLIAQGKTYKYMLSSFFLGIAFTTKFFPGLVLLIPVFLWSLRKSKKELKKWLVSLIFIPLIYLVSYAVYFFYHPSLIEFIRYQLWIISWRFGNPFVIGNIWRTIFTGQYMNWWDGGVVIDQEWTPMFAFVVISGLVGGVWSFLHKQKQYLFIFSISSVYLVYLAVNTVGVARYVLPIYPFLAILSVNLFICLFAIIKKWQKSISKP